MSTHTFAASGAAYGAGAAAAAAAAPRVALVQAVSADFDLDKYAEEYQGIIKVRRLVYIGERCPTLSVAAFRHALRALKGATGGSAGEFCPSVQLYLDVLSRARDLLLTPSPHPQDQFFLSAGLAADVASDPLFQLDNGFQSSATKAFNDRQTYLETQLQIQKRDGDRDAIKLAILRLADFYMQYGDLNASLNKYLESKEFVQQSHSAAVSLELIEIALQIIKSSILLVNMSHVKTQVQRAQRLMKEVAASAAQQASSTSSNAAAAEKEDSNTRIINCKLNAAMGLFHMKGNAYHSAAQSFVQVTSDIQGAYSDVLSGSDIATYGSICALASFSRKELKEQVLNNAEFKKLLDANASNTWKVILQQFYNSNYAKVFEMIEAIKNDLLLDIFLSAHVHRLIRQIREHAFIQYFKAYARVELRVMSVAFNLDQADLERTLSDLIQENKIAARIDSHQQVLYARHADQRNDTFAQSLQVGHQYVRDARALLMRLSLGEHDVMLEGPAGQKAKRSRGAATEDDLRRARELQAMVEKQQMQMQQQHRR